MIAGARRLLGHGRDEALVAGVRRRDRRAFEAIYERHAAQLLTFCIYLLGSRHDAEDALQATFASAYRALLGDSRPVSLRPWLFTIARNECLSILRKRRPLVELNGEVALTGDPVKLAEVHEEMADMIGGIRELPEKQRAALVLAEVHGMSHADIGSILDVRPEQVKAYVFQARSNLLSDRHAREVDCREIREELATSHGLVRTRARLRRHLRACDGCRAYANGVERQHRQLASLLPILPSLTLRYKAIDQALGLCGSDVANYANSATMAGTAIEVAGGGMSALVVKVATGIVAVGASAGVGVSVMDAPPASHGASSAEVRSVASRGELAANVIKDHAGRYDGQVRIGVGPPPGEPAARARPPRRAGANGAEGPPVNAPNVKVAANGCRRCAVNARSAAAPAPAPRRPSRAAAKPEGRRRCRNAARRPSNGAKNGPRRSKPASMNAKQGKQPTGAGSEGELTASKPKHQHTGTERVHGTSGGSGGGSSGSTGGGGGKEGAGEREHVKAQGPQQEPPARRRTPRRTQAPDRRTQAQARNRTRRSGIRSAETGAMSRRIPLVCLLLLLGVSACSVLAPRPPPWCCGSPG